ncbi:MAG: hypothetical protein ACKESB_02230 [Candidatus Hodgkinia cicadicola]
MPQLMMKLKLKSWSKGSHKKVLRRGRLDTTSGMRILVEGGRCGGMRGGKGRGGGRERESLEVCSFCVAQWSERAKGECSCSYALMVS